jgi:hypothetical protein
MCQSLWQKPRISPAKSGTPLKTLPWTDKFCHFVRFAVEVVSGSPMQRRQPRQESGRSRCANNVKRYPPKVLATSRRSRDPWPSATSIDFQPGLPVGSAPAARPKCSIYQRQNPKQRLGFYRKGSGRSRTDDDGFAIRCLSHLATEPTDQESAIGAWRLSFPRGRFRNTGLMPTSGNDCLTSRILVTGCEAVNNQRSQF